MTQQPGTVVQPLLVRPVVLVVDDEPAVLEALSTLLSPRVEPWYRIETAASAEEALEIAARGPGPAERPIALVISDEKMPGASGTDLLIALRQQPAHRDGGRIVVTGYAGLASAKKAINEAEVDKYFPKPWDAERTLLPAVGAILERFARKRGLDRFLLAAPAQSPADRRAVIDVRRAWWEYLTLMGESAEEAGVEAPSFEEPEDAGAEHVVARRLSPREDQPAGALRLRRGGAGGAWILDRLAFAPGEADDALETLLVQAAVLHAVSLAVEVVETDAPVLRKEVYTVLGFSPTGGASGGGATVAMSLRTADLRAPRALAERYRREPRMCACSQSACEQHDYAKDRRGYFCPLDLREGRAPVALQGGGRSS